MLKLRVRDEEFAEARKTLRNLSKYFINMNYFDKLCNFPIHNFNHFSKIHDYFCADLVKNIRINE